MKKTYHYLISYSLLTLLFMSIYSLSFAKNSNPVYSAQSQQALHDMVLEHLKQKTAQKMKNRKISINPISKRIALHACNTGISLEDKSSDKFWGRMTIKLECPKPKWKIYVTAEVTGDLSVIVATQGILKQSVITGSDIKLVHLPYKRVHRWSMRDLDAVIGMRSKKNIGPDSIITINMLQPPYLVFKNQPITILSYIGNLKVTSKGIALKSGTKKQQIPFRNSSSERILKGIVIAPNIVWVP